MPGKKYFFYSNTPKNIRYMVKGIVYGWLGSWIIALISLAFSNFIGAGIMGGFGLFLLIFSRLVQSYLVKKRLMGYRDSNPSKPVKRDYNFPKGYDPKGQQEDITKI